MIRISNLTKHYASAEKTVSALENINIHINKKDIFGIIGLSGAGKSTLIRCMNLLEKPTIGEIFIDDIDLTNLSQKELISVRKEIGMIFQNFNLLMQRNIEKNVAFPLELTKMPKDQIKKRVAELLEIVGLSEKAKSYPAQLSGGQKQRVAIARALASNPKVLLCDEATSALDSMTTKSILQLLKEINERLGVTIVIITHEINVVREICTRVAVIDKSSIVEEGYTHDVLLNPKMDITKQLIGDGGCVCD